MKKRIVCRDEVDDDNIEAWRSFCGFVVNQTGISEPPCGHYQLTTDNILYKNILIIIVII